ncbi:MAG: BatD family protein [Bacteroidales bacterium]|nr:BatD family protein [Bacteroidales bacterium]MDT8372929.1 BatD family protein [Bacteroidales bacterium]
MKRYILILFNLLAALALNAQEVNLTVDAPERAAAGERFRIVYTVNATGGQFSPPAFDPSFSVSGPQQSTSRNVQWINGEMSSVSTTTLIYYVVATMPGRYTIPAASFESKNVTVSAPAREIEIVAGGAAASQSQGQVQSQGQSQGVSQASGAQAADGGTDVSLRLHVSTREVYIGQPVSATLKLYTRVNLSGINELKYPDFKGFLREDLETPELRSLETEVIDGVQYGTGVLQRFLLYPQISGEIRIDPVQMTAMVQQRTSMRDPFFDDPFFDSFFSGVSTVPRSVSSLPVTIRVKPLPEPRPADFHGAVGSFTLSSDLSKSEVEVNDAIDLTISIKGSGNLNLSGEPGINFPQGIEKYDPEVTVRSSGTAAGSKTFKYLLIPRNTGSFEIPPVSYTVFDPQQQKYVTLRSEGYSITVTGSGDQAEVAAPVYVPGEDVKYLGQDIRFIRSGNGSLTLVRQPLVKTTYYWLWFVLALFVASVVLLLRREQLRRNADLTGSRNRKAARTARRRLAKAKALLGSGMTEQANSELSKALWGYLADKLSMPQSQITRENCHTGMRARKVDEGLITEFDSIISVTEYSQYAPRTEGESPAALLERASLLIGKLDNVLD